MMNIKHFGVMKVKDNKRRVEYVVFPQSKKYKVKTLPRKSQVMDYLNSMGLDALDSLVKYEFKEMGRSYPYREMVCWADTGLYNRTGKIKLVLKKEDFRGRKYIFPKKPIAKTRVNYFTFSDKVISLMGYIGENGYSHSNLLNLLKLFHKRGFRDFVPDDNNHYVDHYLKCYTLDSFNEWWYWSDRCNFSRAKVIHNLIKRDEPEVFKRFEEWKSSKKVK